MKKLSRNEIALIDPGRWLCYVAAGAATAAGTAPCVDAAIHYSGPVDFRFGKHGSTRHLFPLSGTALLDMHLGFPDFPRFDRELRGRSATLEVIAMQGSVRGTERRAYDLASNLGSGVQVSQGPFDFAFGGIFYGSGRLGNFDEKGVGFLGFRFDGGNGVQCGWMRISTQRPGHRFTVVDYAWADPGEAILTGQTSVESDPRTAATRSGSLGFLALGSIGLDTWRKARGD